MASNKFSDEVKHFESVQAVALKIVGGNTDEEIAEPDAATTAPETLEAISEAARIQDTASSGETTTTPAKRGRPAGSTGKRKTPAVETIKRDAKTPLSVPKALLTDLTDLAKVFGYGTRNEYIVHLLEEAVAAEQDTLISYRELQVRISKKK
jgi:hypothetical protein